MKKLFLASVATFALFAVGAHAADLEFKPGEDKRFNWASFDEYKASHANLAGQTLTIFGPWRGDDEKLALAMLSYFQEATGINVKYSSSENYEQQIVIDTQAGSPPDVAILPQPGLLADLASKGFLVDLGAKNADWMKENYAAGDSWVKLGTYKDKDGSEKFFAFPYKADLKSLVWYFRRPWKSSRLSPRRWPPTAPSRGASASVRAAPPAGRRPTGSKT
jgi:alpha-glucoside transport system substrate-binding protein